VEGGGVETFLGAPPDFGHPLLLVLNGITHEGQIRKLIDRFPKKLAEGGGTKFLQIATNLTKTPSS
jgi:hypothetical protein